MITISLYPYTLILSLILKILLGIVSVPRLHRFLAWQTNNFTPPKQSDLIIYELLVRDFTANHDYKTLTDTLNYLSNLGVNAIELMPVNEFEGNIAGDTIHRFILHLTIIIVLKMILKLLLTAAIAAA